VHFFQPAMDASVKARTETAQALYQAIVNNEFETYYQPKFDLKNGKLYGFESLIRWKHPKRGLIPPDQFIPVAESTGLIGKIGSWTLRDSCVRGRTWLDQGHGEIEISVN